MDIWLECALITVFLIFDFISITLNFLLLSLGKLKLDGPLNEVHSSDFSNLLKQNNEKNYYKKKGKI